ncbi:hypothetical protein TNCV_1685191 [Trichonephila clavipes]|nr:hypothetical protein TNCV_1685191 [Trichonephila clavipes]
MPLPGHSCIGFISVKNNFVLACLLPARSPTKEAVCRESGKHQAWRLPGVHPEYSPTASGRGSNGPVLEYAAPIWVSASVSSKQKLDSIQHRASKIIIGAVSSTNNEKAEREWGVSPLECRRNLATVKFTNKLRCYKEDHISTRVFNEWSYTKILKRSSTLQLD